MISRMTARSLITRACAAGMSATAMTTPSSVNHFDLIFAPTAIRNRDERGVKNAHIRSERCFMTAKAHQPDRLQQRYVA